MVVAMQRSCPLASAFSIDGVSSNVLAPFSSSETLSRLPLESKSRRAHAIKASLNETDAGVTFPTARRQALVGMGSLLSFLLSTSCDALAAKAPSGFQAVLDKFDNYQFLYPFGWQEVQVKGQDCVYKDVIEPLESVSINIIETNKSDIHELGSAEEVAKALVGKVLASSSQKSQLLDAKERVTDGRAYYTFEFLAKAPNYTRHALGTVTIANGKFYTLTTGANERRWGKMQDKLKTVADSFAILS